MREIKFRAWDKEKINMSSSFSFGDLEEDHGAVGFKNENGFWVSPYELGADGNCVLMQFTGLFDKNGKEIFEGDIVNYSLYKQPDISAVYWGEFSIFEAADSIECWLVTALNFPWALSDLNLGKIEVIGNIFEDPKLLECE